MQNEKPVRIQLSRRRGFCLQEHSLAVNGLECVKVDRATPWGNPFRRDVSGVKTNKEAVRLFRLILAGYYPFCAGPEMSDCARYRIFASDHIHELRGKNLACRCRPQDACHADVLLEIANAE